MNSCGPFVFAAGEEKAVYNSEDMAASAAQSDLGQRYPHNAFSLLEMILMSHYEI